MLVGVVGFINCGKGTVGKFMVNNHNFKTDSFAKSLKDAASAIFGWDREMLEGATPESRFQREQIDRFWSLRLNIKKFTPRMGLQLLGTEGCRHVLGEDIWVSTVEKRWLDAEKPNTIITDCRFPNEIDIIRNNGGVVLRIKRGPEPHFYQLMNFFNRGLCDEDDLREIEIMKATNSIPHESETAWIGHTVDEVIENNGTVEDLELRVRELVEKFTDADTQYTLKV